MEWESKRRRIRSGSSARDEDLGGALNLQVSLPGGRSATFSVLKSGTVADLKTLAQQAFGEGFLRLAAPDGHLLDPTECVEFSGFQDGDSITAVAQQLKIAASESVIILWYEGGDGVALTMKGHWDDEDDVIPFPGPPRITVSLEKGGAEIARV